MSFIVTQHDCTVEINIVFRFVNQRAGNQLLPVVQQIAFDIGKKTVRQLPVQGGDRRFRPDHVIGITRDTFRQPPVFQHGRQQVFRQPFLVLRHIALHQRDRELLPGRPGPLDLRESERARQQGQRQQGTPHAHETPCFTDQHDNTACQHADHQ